jgi:predicted phage-related endonuclease
MKIFDVTQGSEEWDRLRAGRPTASNFSRIITPAKGDYSKQWIGYACELVAQRLGVWTPPPPSYWMVWGTEHEEAAVTAYEAMTGYTTEKVGFCTPDDTDAFGGSPDRLVTTPIDGRRLLEVKCPAPETLIGYHVDGRLPNDYKPQVQGLLAITGLECCDFFAWHPELTPFLLTVERDEEYIDRILDALAKFLTDLERIASIVKRQDHIALLFGEGETDAD